MALDKFKQGEVRVVVATSSLEEGIDVAACKVVVRFDYFASVRSHIQGSGRARHPNAKIFYFEQEPDVEEDKAKGDASMMWLWAGGHELVDRVRQVCKVPDTCKLAILDVGEGMTYQSDATTVTADVIDALTKDFQAGKLEGTSFK